MELTSKIRLELKPTLSNKFRALALSGTDLINRFLVLGRHMTGKVLGLLELQNKLFTATIVDAFGIFKSSADGSGIK